MMDQQIASLRHLWPQLNDCGLYIVEDTHTSYRPGFGGGFRAPESFIEFAKDLIDRMHSWYTDDDAGFPPARLSDRARRDEALQPEIRRVFEENYQVYGVRKVWRQLRREGIDVARCTIGRLMKIMGIQGIIRGKPHRTTIQDKKQPCPMDKVNRQFRVPAPNMLWVSDFTYVATWRGFAYVAFVIDAYARKIVGWRVSTTAHAGFVLDALEQAVHDRRPAKGMGLVHHSDRGSQYLSIRYSERHCQVAWYRL